MPVRTLVLVDRHGSGKASTGLRRYLGRGPRVAALVITATFAFPAAAFAHATLLRTVPPDGAVLAHAPRRVEAVFDDAIHVGNGNAVVANGTQRSVLAGKPIVRGHVLVLPLRRPLRADDYSVRWSVVSDDGHLEQGVFAFGVGAGRSPPHSVLGSRGSLGWGDAAFRGLYLLGVLVAAGSAVFGLLARSVLGDRLRRPLARLLFLAFLAAFVGGSAMLHGTVAGTRFELVLRIALVLTIAAGVGAALAPVYRGLLAPAGALAIALLAAPTLAGHALDRDQPRWLSVPVDLAHLGAAAVWLGGLASLVLVLPQATSDPAQRSLVARRFSATALAAVCVLALTGLGRALTELDAVSQLWSTPYGRALIVKTALLLPLLGLGWLNRSQLLDAFARLRRSAKAESVLLIGVVAAVGVLTQVRPGVVRAGLPSVAAARRPAALPPRSAVVDAHGLGTLVVGAARTPGRATVTVLGGDNTGVDNRNVRIDGRHARPCGSGCYSGSAADGPLQVSVDGARMTFDVPVGAPAATKLLRELTRRYRASTSIVFDESLSANTRPGIRTRFTLVAPDRLRYRTSSGTSAIVIGTRRWDRTAPGRPYVESPQTPLDVTQPLWSDVSNVHRVAPGVLTFLDRGLPAWFRVELRDRRPRVVRMKAAAHFMVERYVAFDGPAAVSPPSR